MAAPGHLPVPDDPARPAAAAPPSNDDLANATPLSIPGTSTASGFDEATNQIGEPECGWYGGGSVWFSLSPTSDILVRATNSAGWPAAMGTYTATDVTDASTLSLQQCANPGDALVSQLTAGTTYYLRISSPWWGPLSLDVAVSEVAPPANDNRAEAQTIVLDETVTSSTLDATVEDGEAFCDGNASPSVWFDFTAAASATLKLALPSGGRANVYTEPENTAVGCGNAGFLATAGQHYMIQVISAPAGATLTLTLAPNPAPTPWMYNVTGMAGLPVEIYANDTGDPVGLFPTAITWDFGDGTTSTTDPWVARHTYAKDGDYTVTVTSTTSDGRTGSGSLLLPIRTHDIAVVSFTAPTNARVGQSKTFVAGIRNTHYVETANVALYRGGTAGWTLVTQSTVTLPVKPSNKTTSVNLPYLFTSADASAGSVSFKVAVTIYNSEKQTTDNEMVCPPVRVTK